MSSYSELIKNFEKIRAYMREFYVYGFKSRSEYDKKSARSYDDERRRMESWLGEHMGFVRSAEGKNVFLSIDSRTSSHNPFYKAWKAKSFTDGDITLHFILFDILTEKRSFSLAEIMEIMDRDYLCHFKAPMVFDESTVRKKLKEYMQEGIVQCEKQGRCVLYRRADMTDIQHIPDVLHFFSEVAPCGVVGSFLLDKQAVQEEHINFKHHYITGAMDSDVMALLFDAMQKKCDITADNLSRYSGNDKNMRLVPLRIFISAQNGRQHLLAYHSASSQIRAFRLDYLSNIRLGNVRDDFDELRAKLDSSQAYMWGVNCKKDEKSLQHVEFTVRVGHNEEHIVNRLQREKRF